MPVSVTEVLVETAEVDTVKVAELAPEAMLTLAGTVADVLEDDKATTTPAGPAGPLRVAVPVAEFPPMTVVGLTVRLVRLSGPTVRVAVCVRPAKEPEMITDVLVETGVVVTVKVPFVAPAASVTDAGNVAEVLLEVSATTEPPVGAGPLRVTVPVEG